MSAVIRTVKNNKLLVLVALIYVSLWFFAPAKAAQSLQNSWYYIREMLLIMPVILLLTSLITAWVPRKTIERNFGENAGFRGSVFSFLLGSFSAGPIYAAFPVCKMLLKKGAGITNVVIILSTWAVIKVPMLLNEAKFLGPKFMGVRWVLTSIAIFLMGYMASRMVKKTDIPMGEAEIRPAENVLHVNHDFCLGCGLCARIAPGYFAIVNKKATVISQNVKEADVKAVAEAVERCAPGIISMNGLQRPGRTAAK